MRKPITILLLLLGGLGWFLEEPAGAQEQASRAQVSAATANALAALRRDIFAARITSTLTVELFLEQTESGDAMDETIQRAQQIGGPRWIDDQTCQVKLEISGARVVYSLVSIAAVRPKLSPLPAGVIEQRLGDWKNRTFAATGTSISAEKVQGIRPNDMGEKWLSISDEARSKAVADAKRDAAEHVLASIRPIELGPDKTVGDVLAREPVQKAVSSWLAERPVTQVCFKDDLQVELTVSTPPDDLFDTVVKSARDVPGATLPSDEKSLAALRREFDRRVSAAIGRAGVSASQPAASLPAQSRPALAADMFSEPPPWIDRPLDVEGVAAPANAREFRLRTKNAAETKATDSLRARIEALPLTESMTIEQAGRSDPRIGDAVNRSLLRARVYKVEYRADGSVMVRIMVDPRELWYELREAFIP